MFSRKAILLLLVFFAFSYTQEIGARYLIITNDSYYAAVLPLAYWKHKKGMRTKIAKLSEIGSSSTAIKAYILNAYNTWQIRPEFVLFVGAPNYLPFPMIGGVYSDNYYTDVDGDTLNEILPGRLTVHDATEAQTVVNKILLYERTPEMTDSQWMINACLIVREDSDTHDDSIYWSDIRYAKWNMLSSGYNTIDTLSRLLGNNASQVVAAVNEGRAYVLYRGQGVNNWWSPFGVDPNTTSNGAKLPIVLSITCATISTGSTATVAERWLLTGTPTTPRGGAGFFATTTVLSGAAHLRSSVCKGFFQGIYVDKKRTFGEACESGRAKVRRDWGSVSEYRGFATLGDPEMNIWTAVPRRITAVHDTELIAGIEETLTVCVSDLQAAPVESAQVCIVLDSTVYQVAKTDSAGLAVFIMTISNPGSMYITVTGNNLYPYEGTISVVSLSANLVYSSHSINDSLGNGNGIVNPGETVLLWVTIDNNGLVQAGNVVAVISTSDPYVYVSDSLALLGTILPGASATVLNPFAFTLSPASNTHDIAFELFMKDDVGNSWLSSFSLSCKTEAPVGPDPYGYYIYDDTDTLTGIAPVYSWLEIAPPAGGPGTIVSEISDEDADTVTVPLPFTFQYYGIDYNSIGMCSNGFLELGYSTHRFGTNTVIPATDGPRGMLAGFWDDLNPGTNGDIYQYYDIEGHRWIAEFYQVAHYYGPGDFETFQLVLLDPVYYPTPTADGEVLYLYNNVANAASNSVGIEDETEMRGLQYVFDNNYDPNAAQLTNGRALLVTTRPPQSGGQPWLYVIDCLTADTIGGNGNGVPEPDEVVQLVLRVKNNGDSIVTNTMGVLRENSTSIDIMDSVAGFGDVDIGATGDNASVPYNVHINTTPADSFIGLVVHFTGNDGTYEAYGYFSLYIGDPYNIGEEQLWEAAGQKISLSLFPNPFRDKASIVLSAESKEPNAFSSIPIASCIKIYDAIGRLVKSFTLSPVSATHYGGSTPSIVWHGDDDAGRSLSAGIYFIHLETEGVNPIQKVILLR